MFQTTRFLCCHFRSLCLLFAIILFAVGATWAQSALDESHADEQGHRAEGVASASSSDDQTVADRGIGDGAWSALGPFGGDVTDVAVSPADPNIVLAGTSPSGGSNGTLYRSADGGNTWSEVTALTNRSVYDIEFAASGKAYIATIDSVWDSTNGGVSWTQRSLGIGANDQVFDVALDASNPLIVWAGIADAAGGQPVNVMRSLDGGVTWANRTPAGLGVASSCNALTVDPLNSNTVIALFGGGSPKIWVTIDGGTNWTNRSAGVPNFPLRAAVYDGGRLLVGGGQAFGTQNVGLYESINLGITWTPIHDGTWPALRVWDIAVDPNDSQKILVASEANGVHRSIDGGATWQIGIAGTATFAPRSVRFRPGSSTDIFLGISSLAVYRSTNGGTSFTPSSQGIAALNLYSIHVNPLNSNEIAAAFQSANSGGVYTTTDGGVTWQLGSEPPTRYSAVRFGPNGTLYAISGGPSSVAPEGLYRRETNGSWTSLGPDQGTLFESNLFAMRFSVNNPLLILAGGRDFGVAGTEGTIWRSVNGGSTWTKVSETVANRTVTDFEIVEDGLDQTMIASEDGPNNTTPAYALRSVDGGVTWSPSATGLPGTFWRSPRLCAAHDDAQTFYFSGTLSTTTSGLFRTIDGGVTWTSTGWSATNVVSDVACHPDARLMFVSLRNSPQAMRSTDGGATFSSFADGLAGISNPNELAFAANTRLVLSSFKGSYGTDFLVPTPTSTSTPTATATVTATHTPTDTPTNTPTASGTPSIEGTVYYGNPASPTLKFISGAGVTGSGSPSVFGSTGPIGQYTLTGFGPSIYTVSVSKTTGQNGISSADAARIAQHVAGTNIIASDRQRIAADVTNNGALSSTDAAQIARFTAGLGPPIGLANQWRFFVPEPGFPTFPIGASPTVRNYKEPIGNPTGQDYIGILIGEVTGNWAAVSLARTVVGGQLSVVGEDRSMTENPITVATQHLVASADKEIVVPIGVEGIADKEVISYEFDLRYDPSVIQPLAESIDVAGTVSRGLSVVTNPYEPGLLRVVVYGAFPIDRDGVLLNLRFSSVGSVGDISALVFERVMFNEGESSVSLAEGKVELF